MVATRTLLKGLGYLIGTPAICYSLYDISGYSVHQVTGRSMQPVINPTCYHNGPSAKFYKPLDWVLVKSCYGDEVKPGDIITLDNPIIPGGKDLKRVIALEKSVVKTRSYKNRVVVVPKGHIWVEGDNHTISRDSNIYGPVPSSLVFGKAIAIVFPPSRVQWLHSQPHPDVRSKRYKSLNAAESHSLADLEDDDDDE